MCTNYTDLNKDFPKDSYPLPSIDRLIDGAVDQTILSFLDGYSGYNQVQMHPRDKEKTTFMTDCNNFCYEVMSFGLKNAGATYQPLMDYIFKGMLSRNVEVYVDNIVQLLRKAAKFQWTNECERIFLQLKDLSASPPVIQKSNATKPITVYLVVSEDAISAALVQEVEKEKRPIYFINRRTTR